MADIFADAQYQAREDLIEMADERNNSITMPGVFPKLSRTPGSVQHLGRALGADNGEIFGELLGLDDGERKSLEDDGVI